MRSVIGRTIWHHPEASHQLPLGSHECCGLQPSGPRHIYLPSLRSSTFCPARAERSMDPEKSRSQALEVQTFEDLLPVRSDSPVFEPSTARQRRHHRAFAIAGKLALAYLGFYLAVSRAVQWIGGNEYCSNWIYRLLPRPTTSKVNWKSCGEGFGDKLQCANVNVPLDYRNASDERMYTVAVTRLLASDKENRCMRPSRHE